MSLNPTSRACQRVANRAIAEQNPLDLIMDAMSTRLIRTLSLNPTGSLAGISTSESTDAPSLTNRRSRSWSALNAAGTSSHNSRSGSRSSARFPVLTSSRATGAPDLPFQPFHLNPEHGLRPCDSVREAFDALRARQSRLR